MIRLCSIDQLGIKMGMLKTVVIILKMQCIDPGYLKYCFGAFQGRLSSVSRIILCCNCSATQELLWIANSHIKEPVFKIGQFSIRFEGLCTVFSVLRPQARQVLHKKKSSVRFFLLSPSEVSWLRKKVVLGVSASSLYNNCTIKLKAKSLVLNWSGIYRLLRSCTCKVL